MSSCSMIHAGTVALPVDLGLKGSNGLLQRSLWSAVEVTRLGGKGQRPGVPEGSVILQCQGVRPW